MADQDELRLRIVPELDQQAKKQVEDELNSISGSVPIGGKPKTGATGEDALRKQRLADYRTEIDLIDLTLRKTTAASQRRQQVLEQEASSNQRSLKETAQLIAQEEAIRESATAQAIQGYDLLEQELQQLGSSQQDVINRQKQLFFASERAKNGFTTMSGSMTALTSNTKSANIAFANFGRIVQDAPFGLLGISNNIDPLLVSFDKLKQESGGTGKALLSMGKQLIGPAGLIFLLGSALPTALLFAQKYFRDTEKESNLAADAVKRVREEFAKLSAQAAGDKGLAQVDAELKANKDSLNAINGSLERYQTNLSEILSLQNQSLQQGGLSQEQQAELNRLRAQNTSLGIGQLQTDKAIIEASTAELEVTKAQITAQNDITSARQRYGIAVALTAQEEKKLAEERAKADKERNALLIQQLSELEPLLALQLSFNEAIRESRDAYLAQALAVRIASQEEARAFEDKIKRETGKGRDTTLTDDSDYERGLAQREALERIEIDRLRRLGKEEEAITLETGIAKRNAVLNLLKLGITDRETIGEELANIEQEGANRTKDNELTVADARAESMRIYADAVGSGLQAIFGENKAIQSAQVVIDTYAGALKAYAALAPNLPLQIAAAGAVTAQGIAALRKINSTQKGTRSVSRTGGGASSSPQPRSFVNDLSVAGQVAGTITPFGASFAPNINITANLDRQGLALAVRDGESDIATRQIPFAS
jgi:hypothetical protein